MKRNYTIEFDAAFAQFLFDKKQTIVFSTYQAGVLMLLGSVDGKKLYQTPIRFKKPMGIDIKGNKLIVAGLEELFIFSNKGDVVNTMKTNEKQFDTVFLQRAVYSTGTLDIHDIAFGDNRIWAVNTLFSCLCTFDVDYSFKPKWIPPFIEALVPEDRCHLNGMVLIDDIPKYVTALSQTNEKEGWRKDIMNTGVLMEVPSGEIICDGLSMPHSPIFLNEKIYLLESGKGILVHIDPKTKKKEIIHHFGRFVRGLQQIDNFLIIGASAIRKSSKSFNQLEVSDNSSKAGIIIYDLNTNKEIASLTYEDTIEEIYDVVSIDGFLKPVIISQYQEQYNQTIVTPHNVFWKTKKS